MAPGENEFDTPGLNRGTLTRGEREKGICDDERGNLRENSLYKNMPCSETRELYLFSTKLRPY